MEGYDLLERKREILMLELMKRIDEVQRPRAGDAQARRAPPIPCSGACSWRPGRDNARELAAGVRADFAAKERRVQVAGHFHARPRGGGAGAAGSRSPS